ncbi:ZIP family metal transporter [Treponema pectinovorum]|uniref:ZIP family metal transporter n=1 Tax=Treponema pectinovorum TaxID=164 RepID=UPI0011CBA034|nr:ZIP family metal transporter [Treponema pectinovorum]
MAIQNFPEGAIISVPLKTEGISRRKSFVYGTLSGVVEPLGAFLMIVASSLFLPVLPYFLAFAAGAMIYVVVEELIPEMSQGVHSDIGTTMFALGFTVMMTLDVVLG